MRRPLAVLVVALLLFAGFVPSSQAAAVMPARQRSRSYGPSKTYTAPDGSTVYYKCRWNGACVCDADHDRWYTRGECSALPADFNRRRTLWWLAANLLIVGGVAGVTVLIVANGRRRRNMTPPPSNMPPPYTGAPYTGGGYYGYRPY